MQENNLNYNLKKRERSINAHHVNGLIMIVSKTDALNAITNIEFNVNSVIALPTVN